VPSTVEVVIGSSHESIEISVSDKEDEFDVTTTVDLGATDSFLSCEK